MKSSLGFRCHTMRCRPGRSASLRGQPMTATNDPLRQLMDPHYEQNLAINKLAMGGLLAQGGTIDTALGGKVTGMMDVPRQAAARGSQ